MILIFQKLVLCSKQKKTCYCYFKQQKKNICPSLSGFVWYSEERKSFSICLFSFTSIWSVKYAQIFYTDVALLWCSPGRDWFLCQTLFRVCHLIIYCIISSEIYWPNKDKETVGNVWIPVQQKRCGSSLSKRVAHCCVCAVWVLRCYDVEWFTKAWDLCRATRFLVL